MKKIILSLLFLTLFLFGCKNESKVTTKYNPKAIELSNRAVNIFSYHSGNKDSTKIAIALFDKAISIDSSYLLAYTNKAYHIIKKSEFSYALTVIMQAQKLATKEPVLWLGQGLLNDKLKKTDVANIAYNKAIFYFDEKIKNDPNDLNIRTNRDFVTLLINGRDSAINELTTLKDKFKDNAEAIQELEFSINMMYELGDREKVMIEMWK